MLQFGGLAVAAGAQQTSVSSLIPFPYRILKVKIFVLDDAVPDLRYYVLVDGTNSTSTTTLPTGVSIFAPYSGIQYIRASQGSRICEPLYDVRESESFLKVHVQNNDANFACDYAAEITIEEMS